MAKILALGGDGIGPEILNEGLRVLAAVSPLMDLEFEIDHDLLHGASYDAHGVFCTDAVLEKARSADAVLVSADAVCVCVVLLGPAALLEFPLPFLYKSGCFRVAWVSAL